MNPQATASPQGAAIAPQPMSTNPQGVASITPLQAPVAPALQQSAAPALSTPPSNPNLQPSTSAQLSNIANYYAIPRDTAKIASAGQAQGAVAQSQFEAQKYQGQLNIEHMKQQLDPSTYSFNHNADGTLTIKNSLGQTVDLATYFNLAGSKQYASPAEVLAKHGATDQSSQQFISAYNNLQSYVQAQIAAKNGDQQAKITVGEFQAKNPGLANLDLGQLQSAFMQQYGQYFGAQSSGNALQQKGVNPTIASQNSPIASSPYYELQQYQQLNQANPITQQLLGGGNNSSAISSLLQSQLTPGQ